MLAVLVTVVCRFWRILFYIENVVHLTAVEKGGFQETVSERLAVLWLR